MIPEIRIKTTKADGFTLLEVADNGLGIKEEDRDSVFAMYKKRYKLLIPIPSYFLLGLPRYKRVGSATPTGNHVLD